MTLVCSKKGLRPEVMAWQSARDVCKKFIHGPEPRPAGQAAEGEGIPHVWNMRTLPVFYLTREGVGLCVRPHRYALAIAGGSVAAGVLGLHECDNPVCVKIAAAIDPQQHVVSGSQGDNMKRMARMRRGGGRHVVRRYSRGVRRERSVALRDAVRHGWDAAAVQAALLGDQPTLW